MKYINFLNEKTDDLGELQKAWNKYKFELDHGTEANAKKWKKKADTILKRVLKQDPDARDASGKPWKDKVAVNETVIVESKDPEEILRAAGLKIKLVHPTKFGTQIDFAKKYEDEKVQELLKGFTLKFDGKSVFIID